MLKLYIAVSITYMKIFVPSFLSAWRLIIVEVLLFAPLSMGAKVCAQEPTGQNVSIEKFLKSPRSVVRVLARKMEDDQIKQLVSGTGFLVTTGGLLLTNYHVVCDSDVVEAFFLNEDLSEVKPLECRIVMANKEKDIAILQIKGELPWNLPDPLSLASTSAAVLDNVAAIGFPTSLDQDTGKIIAARERLDDPTVVENFKSNVTLGAVSKIGTEIVHDAKIGPGNSGGPLVSVKTGEVVGVNSAITRTEGFSLSIPSKEAITLLRKLSNIAEHIALLKNMADNGLPKGAMEYADMLLDGHMGVDKDPKAAEKYLLEAAKNGSMEALCRLSVEYEKGSFSDGKPDYDSCIEMLEAIDTADSYMHVFDLVSDEQLSCYSPSKTLSSLKNAAALGSVSARAWLGMGYCTGKWWTEDCDEAIKQLDEAVMQREKLTKTEMDGVYRFLVLSHFKKGEPDNFAKAAYILKQHIENHEGLDHYIIAIDYFENQNDKESAFEHIKLATQQDYAPAFALAGVWHIRNKNKSLGRELSKLAVEKGCSDGYFGLIFTSSSDAQWTEYMKKGLDEDSGACIALLGFWHHKGIIVKKDLSAAKRLYNRALESSSYIGKFFAGIWLNELENSLKKQPRATKKKK